MMTLKGEKRDGENKKQLVLGDLDSKGEYCDLAAQRV